MTSDRGCSKDGYYSADVRGVGFQNRFAVPYNGRGYQNMDPGNQHSPNRTTDSQYHNITQRPHGSYQPVDPGTPTVSKASLSGFLLTQATVKGIFVDPGEEPDRRA